MQYYNVFFFQCMGLICSYTFESENLLITINGIYALLGECIASKITHLVGCSNNTYCDSGMNFLFSYFLSFLLAFFLFRFHFGLFLSEGIKGAFVFSLRSVRVRKHDSRFVDSMVVCDGYCYCFRPNVHTLQSCSCSCSLLQIFLFFLLHLLASLFLAKQSMRCVCVRE